LLNKNHNNDNNYHKISLVNDIDLETSRSLIAVIPQDPHLFSGTIRYNLDPFGVYSDTEIWNALEDAHIKDYVLSLPNNNNNINNNTNIEINKLYSNVEENGKNFSVGQRQLLSLARAILRKCNIILMDEVSASIDFVTDKLIQETIRTSIILKNATIITIAHRLRTIADSDMIVVINDGTIYEIGTPYELLTCNNNNNNNNSNNVSIFKELAIQSNEFNEILSIAKNNVK